MKEAAEVGTAEPRFDCEDDLNNIKNGLAALLSIWDAVATGAGTDERTHEAALYFVIKHMEAAHMSLDAKLLPAQERTS